MILFWNYTIEAFFWILLGAITLVSLTIFFARPKQKSKLLPVLEKRDGKIIESGQYAKKESNLNFDSEKSRPVTEDEKFEEFVETLPKRLQAIVSMRTYIGIFYGLLILSFGFIDLEIGVGVNNQQDFVAGNGFFIFFTTIFGSVAFIYGLIQRSYFSTRWGARLMTTYCIFFKLFTQERGASSYEILIVWSILGGIGILYSFNLTQLSFTSFEKRPDSYDKNNVRYYQWFFEFMNGERPAAARLLLYLLIFFFFLMSFGLLATL